MEEKTPELIMIDVASLQEAGVDVVSLIDNLILTRLDEDYLDNCHLLLVLDQRLPILPFSSTMIEALTAGLMDLNINYRRYRVPNTPATIVAMRMAYTAAKNMVGEDSTPISYRVITRSKSVFDQVFAATYALHDMYGRKFNGVAEFSVVVDAPIFKPQETGAAKLGIVSCCVAKAGAPLDTIDMLPIDDVYHIFSEM